MGLTNWIVNKFLSDENIGLLVEKVRPHIQKEMDQYAYDTVVGLLENEEIAVGIDNYSKVLLDKRLKQFWGSVGGTSKGVNHQIDLALQSNNPLDNIIDSDGHLNLGSIIKGFLSGQFKGALGQSQPMRNVTPGQNTDSW